MITPVRSALISPSLNLAYQRVGLAVFWSLPSGVAVSGTALTAAVAVGVGDDRQCGLAERNRICQCKSSVGLEGAIAGW
jgi:hypothetical protein